MQNNSTNLKESTYKKLKIIGQGAYGKVYQVQHRETKVIYAMKKISLAQQSEKETQSTLNEITILCSFDHENICGYVEAFVSLDLNYMYIVMEYIGGGDLQSKLK